MREVTTAETPGFPPGRRSAVTGDPVTDRDNTNRDNTNSAPPNLAPQDLSTSNPTVQPAASPDLSSAPGYDPVPASSAESGSNLFPPGDSGLVPSDVLGATSPAQPARLVSEGNGYRFHLEGRPTHVARMADLDHIREIYDAEEGATLIFTGPTGTGKSFLLEAASQDPTMQTRYLQVNANERDWPLSGLSTLLALLPEEMAPELGQLLEDPSQPLFTIASKLLRGVRDLPLSRMLLLIDDLDLMDPDSLRVVGFVARRLSETVLRMVATASELPVAGPLAGIAVHRLDALPWRESVNVGFDIAGQQAIPAIVHAAVAVSAGSPLALTEAINVANTRHWGRGDPVTMPMRLGPGTAAVVHTQLAGLSGKAQRALALASTAAVTPLELADLVGAPALNELEHAGLLERVGNRLGITDPRVRSVVYWAMTPHLRGELHEAMRILSEPVDRRLALWHGSFGGRTPEGTSLLEAAVSFVAEGAVGPAMELVERNLMLRSLDNPSAALLVQAADRLLGLGEIASVNRLVDLAAGATCQPVTLMQIALLKVRVAFIERQEILEGVARSAVQLHGEVDPALTVTLMDNMAFALGEMLHLVPARNWWREAEERVSQVDPTVESFHRTVGDFITTLERGGAGQPAGGGTVNHEYAPRDLYRLLLTARGLTYCEDYLDARAMFSVITNNAALPPLWSRLVTLYSLDNELQAGNLFKATEIANRIIGTELTTQTHQGYRAHLLSRYWMVMGRGDLAEPFVTTTRRLACTTYGASLSARSYALTGSASLARGRFIDAVRQLSQAEQFGGQVANPFLLGYQGNLIEALVRVGRLDEASRQLSDFEERLRKYPSQWGALVLGRCRALLMSGNRSLTAFRRHLAAWPNQSPDTFNYLAEYGRTLVSFGERLAEYGERAESIEQFSRAAAVLDDIGHETYAGVIRERFLTSRPAPAPVEYPALALLNPNELLVAEKVVSGMRNRDIAEGLFVSVRTVEVRLTGIYRKLGVKSRSELMALSNHGESSS